MARYAGHETLSTGSGKISATFVGTGTSARAGRCPRRIEVLCRSGCKLLSRIARWKRFDLGRLLEDYPNPYAHAAESLLVPRRAGRLARNIADEDGANLLRMFACDGAVNLRVFLTGVAHQHELPLGILSQQALNDSGLV